MAMLKVFRSGMRMSCDHQFEESGVLGRQMLLAGHIAGERRAETRYPIGESCVVSVLGDEQSRTSCTLINVSRSGLRIAVDADFPTSGELNVEWGSAFFVGTVCNSQLTGGQQTLGLRLVCTNVHNPPLRALARRFNPARWI